MCLFLPDRSELQTQYGLVSKVLVVSGHQGWVNKYMKIIFHERCGSKNKADYRCSWIPENWAKEWAWPRYNSIYWYKVASFMNIIQKLSLDRRKLNMPIRDFHGPSFHWNIPWPYRFHDVRNMWCRRGMYASCSEHVETRCDFPSKRTKFCFQW